MEPTDQQAELDELRAKLAELEQDNASLRQQITTVISGLRWTGDGYEWTGSEYDYRIDPARAVEMMLNDRKRWKSELAAAERQRDEALELLRDLKIFAIDSIAWKKVIEKKIFTLPGIAGPEQPETERP